MLCGDSGTRVLAQEAKKEQEEIEKKAQKAAKEKEKA
jgi:hypothetical protein